MAQFFYFAPMPVPYLQISIFNIGFASPVLVGVPPYQQSSFPYKQQHHSAYQDEAPQPQPFTHTSAYPSWHTPETQWGQQSEATQHGQEEPREFQARQFAEQPAHETPRTIEPEQVQRFPTYQPDQLDEHPREQEEQEPMPSSSHQELPQPVQLPVGEPPLMACNGIHIASIQQVASNSPKHSQEELNMLYVPCPPNGSNGEEPRDDLHQPGSNGIILRCRHGYQSTDQLYVSHPNKGEILGKIIGRGSMPTVPEDGFDVLDRRTGLLLGRIYRHHPDRETRGRRGRRRQGNKDRDGRFRPY